MKDKEYYNKIYRESEEYKKPYSDFLYYNIYKIALGFLNIKDHILELGCGAGQFSDMLEDNLYRNYTGVDISDEAIRQANKKTLLKYEVKDIMTDDLNYDYNTVVAFEFIEHIEYKKIFKKLIIGSKIIFSVPNFANEDHLYTWQNEAEIIDSFKKYININTVECVLKKGFQKWFLITGKIK